MAVGGGPADIHNAPDGIIARRGAILARGGAVMATLMTDRAPKPGDRAPDFELPAADHEGTLSLGDYLRRGPVLLVMLTGLYCPFCRRHISQLRPACEALRVRGIELVGIVVASAERARRYFHYRPSCFPMAAAPDRAIHRAYGLPSNERSPAFREETERLAASADRARPRGRARSGRADLHEAGRLRHDAGRRRRVEAAVPVGWLLPRQPGRDHPLGSGRAPGAAIAAGRGAARARLSPG